jgi:hypothetical protein
LSDPLSLIVLPKRLTICKLPATAPIPGWATTGPLCSISRTTDELSVVVPESNVPTGEAAEGDVMHRQDGWRALKVKGPLDFALTGILASLATPLAEAGVPILAISTYETDYVLVPEPQLRSAVDALRKRGHHVSKAGRTI